MRNIVTLLIILFCNSVYAAEIGYEIIEKSSATIIAKGIREYGKEDLLLSPYVTQGRHVVEKFIELEKGFKVGARIFQEHRLAGFGLVAQLTDEDFSWEWYNHKEGNLFVKLQGGTLAKVKSSGLPVIEILEEVEFLEDTKLCFQLGGPGRDESHDIVIKKGSVLKFN